MLQVDTAQDIRMLQVEDDTAKDILDNAAKVLRALVEVYHGEELLWRGAPLQSSSEKPAFRISLMVYPVCFSALIP